MLKDEIIDIDSIKELPNGWMRQRWVASDKQEAEAIETLQSLEPGKPVYRFDAGNMKLLAVEVDPMGVGIKLEKG